jgi:hypothetical protein
MLQVQQRRRRTACVASVAAKPAFPTSAGWGITDEEGDMPAGTPLQKGTLVARLIAAKEASGKSFSAIAAEVGVTNVYCTQLFYNQVAAGRGDHAWRCAWCLVQLAKGRTAGQPACFWSRLPACLCKQCIVCDVALSACVAAHAACASMADWCLRWCWVCASAAA